MPPALPHTSPISPVPQRRSRRRTLGLCAMLSLAGVARAVPVTITVVDAAAAPLANAVVAVEVHGAPTHAPAGATAELAQQGKRFRPEVLAIQTGTAVNFPNLDTVRHHVYSFSPAKTFELKLYAGTPAAPVVFDKPGTAVLGCNIHDAMSASVRIVDTPYFARTNEAGQARLDVPVGDHRLQTWHASLPLEAEAPVQPLKVGPAAQQVTVNLGAP